MAITTKTQLSNPVNRVLQEKLLRNAKARTPYFLGSVAGEIKHHAGTDVILWIRIDNMTPTTTALTELSGNLSIPPRTATQLSDVTVTATILKYGDFVYTTEEVDLTWPTSFNQKRAEVLGIQAGQSLNRLQRNGLEDNQGSNLFRAGGVSADADVSLPIDRNLIRRAVNTLQRNDALMFTAPTLGSTSVGTMPQRPTYWGLCHVDVEADIRELTGFIGAEKYANQGPTIAGEFGSIEGVRWVSSSEGSIDTNTGGQPGNNMRSAAGSQADLYTPIIIGQDHHASVGFDTEHVKEVYMAGDVLPAVEIISHARGSSGVGDALNEIASHGWKAFHARSILNAAWGTGLRCGATNLQ